MATPRAPFTERLAGCRKPRSLARTSRSGRYPIRCERDDMHDANGRPTGVTTVRPHRARLDGEGDDCCPAGAGNLIHHPDELDGALASTFDRLLASHLVHQSAQGGWGPTRSSHGGSP